MPKPIIFISHISKEAELAEILKVNLVKDFLGMIEVFVSSDSSSIQLGQKWLDELDKNLKEAQIEIVLCSKDSVVRPWINFEAGGGWVRGIPVVPICHTDIKPTELPIPLNMLEAIQANDAPGINKLYKLISNQLGATLPATDYTPLINEIKDIEKKYRDVKSAEIADLNLPATNYDFPNVKRILKPKILCVSSRRFETLGFDKDLETIQSYFPDNVTTKHNITSKELRNILAEQKFDILHILSDIETSGDLVFSDEGSKVRDHISAEGFAKLIEVSRISLVVTATCDSLPLAPSLNRKTNLIAAMDRIQVDEVISWEDCFYQFLSKGFSITKAYELTKSFHSLPMLLIPAVDAAFAAEH